MASLSIARPGKVPERQYLGDLAGLFERQRRRCNVALTPESFASDLAAHDALRSGLFTLCTAISHMGASDLSSEELLGLIARALGGAGSAEGESGAQIPDSMRDAFLKGYDAWSNREPVITDLDAWPPAAAAVADERKPPAREASLPLDSVESSQAIAAAGSSPVVPGRRTVQEALSMVRKEPSAEPAQRLTGENGEDLGSMTLGELKNFLADIEHRVSRLGPHLQQLATGVAPAPSRTERADSFADTVIPFPSRRAADPAEGADVLSHDFNLDAFARRRSSAAPAPILQAAAEETVQTSRAEAPDDRPRGIDALLAAAPAWANASPTARAFNEDSFLARHAYLSPSRRPGGDAPASLFYSVTPAAPLAPPSTVLPAAPAIAAIVTMPHPPAPELVRAAPTFIGLDVEEDPLLSPLERLQNVMMRLPPRKVFIALAGLTIFAGGLAGFMAYHTLHPYRAVQFKDLQQVHFGVDSTTPAATPPDAAPAASVPTASTAAGPAPQPAIAAPPVPAVAAHVQAAHVLTAPVQQPSAMVRPKPHALPHPPAVAVWPPVPQDLARADAAQPAPATAQPSKPTSAPHPTSSAPLSVSTSTMIGYALTTPQPAYPSAQAHGISGSVVLEVIVSRLGDVTSVRAISGPAELRPAAMAAVREWRFRPYVVSGKAAEVTTTLPFYFKGQ